MSTLIGIIVNCSRSTHRVELATDALGRHEENALIQTRGVQNLFYSNVNFIKSVIIVLN